jgi:hypothetical protein
VSRKHWNISEAKQLFFQNKGRKQEVKRYLMIQGQPLASELLNAPNTATRELDTLPAFSLY